MRERLTRSVTLSAMMALMALLLTLLSPLLSDGSTAFAADKPGKTATPATVTVNGQDPKAAQNGTVVNHKNSTDKVQLAVSLNYRNQDKLKTLLSQLYDPTSANYHKFLTPDQFAREFGANASDAAQVKQFLASNGLSVTGISSDNTLIDATGPASAVEQAFEVTLNNYQDKAGHTYYANDVAPKVPTALSGLVLNVHGLDNQPRWKPANVVPNVGAHVGSGPAGGYTPSELRGAYDVNPLISGGYNGTGQTVAVFELDGYVQSNISTYVSNYGLGSPAPQNILVDSYNGAAGSGEVEVELDIEVVNAIAPKAQVLVYEGPNSSAGVVDTYKRIATDNRAKVISTSWGQCEPQSSSSDINSEDQVYQQYAAQGQSIFAAAGDTGAYDCRGNTTQLAVDNPADDPYVTGVGGTNLTLSGTTYSSEKVWNVSSTSAGGGGISTIFTKPSYQTGPGTTNSYSNGNRQVPDVSADADPNTGYSIYSQSSWTVVGGTSAAAPLWAGIAALNNQYAAGAGKGNLGQANPTLYRVFGNTQTYPAFHDITSGTNRYYPATSGYDEASGIGTPDAYNLIRDINGASAPPPPPPGGGGTTQLITNGGFESGASPWVETSSGGYEIVDATSSSVHHSGSASAWLCGYNNCTDTIYQTVSIPSTATKVTLTFYVYITTQETTHSYDFFTAQVRNTSGTVLATVKQFSDGSTTGSWQTVTYDLTGYKGQTVQIYFKGTNDVSNVTNFFLDDVGVVSQ